MTKRWRFPLALFLVLMAALPQPVQGLPPVQLTLLHINDFHGHLLPELDKSISDTTPVGGAGRLAQLIAAERAKNPDGVVLLSAGDMFQGTPVSNVFRGQPVIEVMNYLKFDAMALGNHEFDWGLNGLRQLAAAAAFPFLAANIRDDQGSGLALTRPYIILERKGFKLAVIGITTPDTAFTTKPEHVARLTFQQPVEVLPQQVQEIRNRGADLIVLLSHSGLDADLVIAQQVPGIDVIVGGHSHTVVTHPLRVNDTLIVQAGSYGAWLGVLELEVDIATRKVLSYNRENELRPVLNRPGDAVDENATAIVDRFNDQIKTVFACVVGETTVDLKRNRREESNVGNLIADDNLLVAMDLTGEQVRGILEQSAGSPHQLLQVSGLSVHFALGRPPGSQVTKIMVGHEPLAPDKIYRVATNDFLAAGGDEITLFREGRNVVYGDSLRDVVIAYLEKHSPVHPLTQNRIEMTKP